MNKKLAVLAAVWLAVPAVLFGQGVGVAPAVKPAAPPPPAAMPQQSAVTAYRGFVTVKRAGSSTSVHLQSVPVLLEGGDQILTGPQSLAVLTLQDASQIRVGPSSRFVLAGESKDRTELYLDTGKLWADVVHLAGRVFMIRTPGAVASVRGTRFSVAAVDSNDTVTEVYQGAVAVQALLNGQPSGPEALVGAGQKVEAVGGKLSSAETILKSESGAAPSKKTSDAATPSAADQEARAQGQVAPAEQEVLRQAFEDGQSLEDAQASIERSQIRQQRAAEAASAAWSVSREIGLQAQQMAVHSVMAQSAAGPMVSQASIDATQAAYQQQSSQQYYDAKPNLGSGPVRKVSRAQVAAGYAAVSASPAYGLPAAASQDSSAAAPSGGSATGMSGYSPLPVPPPGCTRVCPVVGRCTFICPP